MGNRSNVLGMLILIGIAITVLFIGWYLVGMGEKGGPLEQGVQAVDESKAVRAAVEAQSIEENKIMDQLP